MAQAEHHVQHADDVRALVAAAIDGDEWAWTQIVRRYETLVTSVARRHRLSADEVDDVAGATWAQLVRHLAGIREPACLPGWLATTAARESLRLIRGRRRERPTDLTESHLAVTGPSPEVEVVEADERRRLHDAVSRLPDRYRPVIDLLLGPSPLPYADIAARLGLPVGSIGPMRARGCRHLRRDAALVGSGPSLSLAA